MSLIVRFLIAFLILAIPGNEIRLSHNEEKRFDAQLVGHNQNGPAHPKKSIAPPPKESCCDPVEEIPPLGSYDCIDCEGNNLNCIDNCIDCAELGVFCPYDAGRVLCPDPIPWPKRIAIRHVQGWGEGIGFGTNYSTLELFCAPDYRLGRILPFLDLRGHRFDNNLYAANVGVGVRYIPGTDCFCEMLGFNIYYDFRQGFIGNYNQLGAGIEVLAARWDLRANVYAPFGNSKHRRGCCFTYSDGDFFICHKKCEFANYGFNAEFGYLLVRTCDFLLYGAAGPYYLTRRCDDDTVGGKARIRPQYRDYVALEASYSYDSVYRSVWQLEIILNFPIYQISSSRNQRNRCCFSDRQIYQPVERFEVMPLGRRDCWFYNF